MGRQIHVKLSDETADWLDQQVSARNTSRSMFVERALRYFRIHLGNLPPTPGPSKPIDFKRHRENLMNSKRSSDQELAGPGKAWVTKMGKKDETPSPENTPT